MSDHTQALGLIGVLIVLGIGLGLVGIVKTDQETTQMHPRTCMGFFYANLEEGQQIEWDIETQGGEVNLFIYTADEYPEKSEKERTV